MGVEEVENLKDVEVAFSEHKAKELEINAFIKEDLGDGESEKKTPM
jgi:hypothetical protein